MLRKKVWVASICVGLLFTLSSTAVAQQRELTDKDVKGISPHHFKYIITTVGGAALGAGLGFMLGGGLKTGKLALIGGGAASTWFLYTHPATLGSFHDWAMVGSGTTLGMGLGWTICNCDNGLIAGTLLGGGGTAVWEALKHDSAARNSYNKATGKTTTSANRADQQTQLTAYERQQELQELQLW
jgi:hypothetical protein